MKKRVFYSELAYLFGLMILAAGTALMDFTLSGTDEAGESVSLPMKLWYSPTFVGMSSTLFGNDTFYGLAPQDTAAQLEGTDFAALFSLNTEALGLGDGFLSSLPAGPAGGPGDGTGSAYPLPRGPNL